MSLTNYDGIYKQMTGQLHIGFIGLGNMGSPIAGNLARCGYAMTVWDRNPSRAELLTASGCTKALSARGAVGGADVVITMLPNDDATLGVVVESGVINCIKGGCTVINMSTVSPSCADVIASACGARAISYVACPVLGRPDSAAARALYGLMAGGERGTQVARGVLSNVCKEVKIVGSTARVANIIKIEMNMVILAAATALAEAAAVCERFDVRSERFIETATETLFAHPPYTTYGKIMIDRKYVPAKFSVGLGLKDINLALSMCRGRGVIGPISDVVGAQLAKLAAKRGESVDCAALLEMALSEM